MSRIYLDYASLTPIDRRVLHVMKKYSAPEYANPSSIYLEGVDAKKAMEKARQEIARAITAHADEIIFTSGGTEANGLALEGAGRTARRNGNEKPHIIVSAIEHSSIMSVVEMLEKHGVEVTRLGVDATGQISLDELKKSIKPSTYMVSIMAVNNEIGTIQPIKEIAKVIRHARHGQYPLFHCDASQALLYMDINMEKLGIDLMTMDGSKIYGPRGFGALYVRRGAPIEPIMYGGGQEKGMRSGTENIPAIMGFAEAMKNAVAVRVKESARISELKKYFADGLKKIRADISFNPASSEAVAPHILNVSIPKIDNEFLVLQLDVNGVACSTKSSCLRDSDESYVLQAIGAKSAESIRFSFGSGTKKRHLKKALKTIQKLLI